MNIMHSSPITLLILLFSSILISGCSPNEAGLARSNEMLIRLADDEAKGLDPPKVSDLASLRIAMDQFEGLTRMSASGEAEAGLALDPIISDDGRTWRFQIKQGARFSDGKAIKAETFVASFANLVRLQARAQVHHVAHGNGLVFGERVGALCLAHG